MILAAVTLVSAACDREEVLAGKVDRTVNVSTVPQIVSLIVPPPYPLRPGLGPREESASLVERQEETGTDLEALKTTAGELELLRQAGAGTGDPGIRTTITRENSVLSDDPEFVDALLFSEYPTTPPVPEIIEEDAAEDETGSEDDDGGFWDWF
ncbi:MAG: DUF3035 domain-containing protein [bacterium]|nr:DUF3035 domain-containing protein [bacterium]